MSGSASGEKSISGCVCLEPLGQRVRPDHDQLHLDPPTLLELRLHLAHVRLEGPTEDVHLEDARRECVLDGVVDLLTGNAAREWPDSGRDSSPSHSPRPRAPAQSHPGSPSPCGIGDRSLRIRPRAWQPRRFPPRGRHSPSSPPRSSGRAKQSERAGYTHRLGVDDGAIHQRNLLWLLAIRDAAQRDAGHALAYETARDNAVLRFEMWINGGEHPLPRNVDCDA